MKSIAQLSRTALAVGMLAAGSATFAQEAAAPEPQADIIVTGTRATGMAAADSPAPIQMLGSDLLARTAQPDLSMTLAQNLPSVQAQSFGTDLQQVNLSFRLRGLSPNHTLVLLNGKRRHGTANVSVAGGIYSGAASPDISFIASDSIDHIEVLQDGAAAQYGTDAIAGVINIIQKKANHGGSLSFTMGQYYDQYDDGSCPGGQVDHCMATGGRSWALTGNIGIEPFEGAYLNLSGERRHRGRSVRTHYDARYYDTGATNLAIHPVNGTVGYLERYPDLVNNPTYPYLEQRQGDPDMDITNIMYNAGYEFGDFEVYSFGSYGHKNASTLQVFRTPDGTSCVIGNQGCTVDGAGPFDLVNPATGPVSAADAIPGTTRRLFNSQGYEPSQVTSETDYAFTGGFRGTIGNTTFDLASTYGKDLYKFYVTNSANISMFQEMGFTPNEFRIGSLSFSQWSNQLDLTHELDIGLDNPVTIAAGLEYRHEKYAMGAGDPSSYYGGGAQSFYGWTDENERIGRGSRNNFSQYIDVSIKPTDKWIVDAAARHEHYSDFGDTTVFKLTSRYDFSDAIAIRGTVSTGFRAPTLAEEYYAGVNVSTNYLAGIFPANGDVVSNLGFGNLKPEKSTNFSLGFVLHPIDRLAITIDGYLIKLRDRIVLGPTLYGYSGGWCPLPAGTPGAAPNEIAQSTNPNATNYVGPGQGITFDANGIGTATGGCQTPATGRSVADYLDSFRLNNQGVMYDVMTNAVSDIPPAVMYMDSNPALGRSATGGRGGYLSVQNFVNALSVRTVGIDFQANYTSNFGDARVNWLLAINYNKNKITKVNPLPSTLYTSELQPAQTTLYSEDNVIAAERPSFRATVGANLTWGKFNANLRGNYYNKTWSAATVSTGTLPSALEGLTDFKTGEPLQVGGYYKDYTNAAFIVDLEVGYQITKAIKFSVGANNLFNHYANPSNWDFLTEPRGRLGNGSTLNLPYRTGANYGYNGGYYYARIGVKF